VMAKLVFGVIASPVPASRVMAAPPPPLKNQKDLP
jgi:hypothetical protein